VVIQGDAVKAVVWAAILSLVVELTSGPDPFPPLSKRPGQVSRILPSQGNTVSTFVSALILGSENYMNSRVETAVTRGVHRPMSPLDYMPNDRSSPGHTGQLFLHGMFA
jgi:hypothetical protein